MPFPHNAGLDGDSEQTLAWSRELRARLERHPRSAWREAPTPSARFWLEVHDGFRREAEGLISLLDRQRSGRFAAGELAAVSGARLRGLIVRLRGHHEIEDFEYFPALRALEPKLAPGFDLLASDHARLQRQTAESLSALAELLAAVDAKDAAATAWVTDRYASRTEELCRTLARHLHDEEELIIPLLLEQ